MPIAEEVVVTLTDGRVGRAKVQRAVYSPAEMMSVIMAIFQPSDDRVAALSARMQDLRLKGLAGRGVGRGRRGPRYSQADIVDYVVALDLMQFGLSAVAAVAKLPQLKHGEQVHGGLHTWYDFDGRTRQVASLLQSDREDGVNS